MMKMGTIDATLNQFSKLLLRNLSQGRASEKLDGGQVNFSLKYCGCSERWGEERECAVRDGGRRGSVQ